MDIHRETHARVFSIVYGLPKHAVRFVIFTGVKVWKQARIEGNTDLVLYHLQVFQAQWSAD